MDKYKKLTENTVIFFLGEIFIKVAALFMLRYYTNIFTTSEYGIIDLIITTSFFIIPFVTLGINQAVLRFSLDKNIDQSQVLTIGILIAVIGHLLLLILINVIDLKYALWDYIVYIWMISFASSIKAITMSYCRGIERSKLYTASGMILSVIQIIAAITLISGFHLQIKGYVFASTLSSSLTVLIILFAVRKEFHFRLRIDKALVKQMVVYSIPLIVYIIGWEILSFLDRYIILSQLSTAENGMYSAASKVPMLITTASAIFMKAWQVSSVNEVQSAAKEEFYNNIFQLLHIALALVSMVILILIRPIYSIIVGAMFDGCWQYTPFLIISAIFACFVGFLQTNYIAMKKTMGVVFSTIIAAVINLILNMLLTKHFGINGTAFATMLSFIIFWLLIMFNTAKYVKIRIDYKKFIPTYLLLLAQAFIIANGKSLYPVQAALIVLVILLNLKDIKTIVQKVIYRLRRMR